MTKDRLVERVVNEVMHLIEGAGDSGDVRTEGVAVFLTTYVPGYRRALKKIEDSFGGDAEFIGFGGAGLPEGPHMKTMDAGEAGNEAVLDLASHKKSIVLLSPSLALLDDIANGRDERFEAYAVIRCILWGKDVTVLLDFEPPRFRRNTLYEKAADVIGALKDAGIRIMTYRPAADPEMDLLQLVTENDIKEAYKNRMTAVKKAAAAIVTPAAKDASRQLGIKID